MNSRSLIVRLLVLLGLLSIGANHTLAVDGAAPPPGGGGENAPTYFEAIVSGGEQPTNLAGVPTLLALDDSEAVATYSLVESEPGQLHWRFEIRNYLRRHETPDLVYNLIVAIPLPADSGGEDAFAAEQRAIPVTTPGGAPFVYGGRALELLRNHSLEKSLLPGVTAGPGLPGKLPDLAGTGYRYTLWNVVVVRDPEQADAIAVEGAFEYATADTVAAPDPSDDRFAAYVITWVPSLSGGVAPYTVRVDVE